MSILTRTQILIIAAAIAASVGLVGCGGGGGGAAAVGVNTPVGPTAPTADLATKPTVTIDFKSAATLQANADTFVAAAREAVNSLIKTGAMYGIFSMTTPWPTTAGTTLSCVGSLDTASNSVVWNGTNSVGGTGNARYWACNAFAGVGPVDGVIALTYSAYTGANDFVADMSTPGIDIFVSSSYAPSYMVPAGAVQAEFIFAGQYTFNPTTHSPVYSVDTGTAFGSQRVIGQPYVMGNSGTFIIKDPPSSASFNPTQVLVRSNIDAKGNWVQMHFSNWDVETSSGKPLPAKTCAGACILDITDAIGNKASINAVPGAAQTMVFTPAASGVAPTQIPVLF